MSNYKLKYDGKEVDVDYEIYHLTKNGLSQYVVHEISYKDRTFRGKSLERCVGSLIKFLKRKQ